MIKFTGLVDTINFNILKLLTNEWTTQLTIQNWTYGTQPFTPYATAKYGTVNFTYSSTENTFNKCIFLLLKILKIQLLDE